MSEKTISLLSENQMLQQRNAKLKTSNNLLFEIEKIIGKKNKTNQQVMKWIIEQKKFPNINIDKIVEREIFKDVEKNNLETFKIINEKNSHLETMEEKKEGENNEGENSDNNKNIKITNREVDINNEIKDIEENRSNHIMFKLNNGNGNNSGTIYDKKDNKKNKLDRSLKRNKDINDSNINNNSSKSNNNLEESRSFNNSEVENETKNILYESDTKSKLVLQKMLTNNYKKLNSDIDLINRGIRLQELINMLTSFFLFFPENNNYPFVEVYDKHRNKRNKKEIKDFIDKKQILDHLEENIEDFNDQLAGMEEFNDDNAKNEDTEDSIYNVEINEKYEKFPESRNIHIYETDDLSDVIEK
eukprot:jgi/Orpsp1_1/1191810/evm.model.d7180000088658.1